MWISTFSLQVVTLKLSDSWLSQQILFIKSKNTAQRQRINSTCLICMCEKKNYATSKTLTNVNKKLHQSAMNRGTFERSGRTARGETIVFHAC